MNALHKNIGFFTRNFTSVSIENEINLNRLDLICSVTRDREEPGIYCVKSLPWFLVLQLHRTEVHSLLIPEHINGRFLISFLSCLKSVSKARMSTLKTPRGKGNTQKIYSELSLVNFHEAQTLTVRLVSFGNIRRDSMSSWIFPTSVNFSSSK